MAGEAKAAQGDETAAMTGAKVSRISIGRLYSLGNYEHVRVELTLDIPEGESAAGAFRGAMKILTGLNPKKGRVESYELKRAHQFLSECGSETEFDAITLELRTQKAKDIIAKDEAYRARLRKAADALDDLGGVSVYTDAKLDWDDEDDY